MNSKFTKTYSPEQINEITRVGELYLLLKTGTLEDIEREFLKTYYRRFPDVSDKQRNWFESIVRKYLKEVRTVYSVSTSSQS